VTKGANEYKGAPARVVFADDDAILRELLRGLLGFLPHVTVVGEAADGIEAVQLVARHSPTLCCWTSVCRASTASE
jgi:DNA-binding NarL/FixJ family response regulator